jgi:hypothetical protein
MWSLYVPRGQEIETLPDRCLAIQPKTKAMACAGAFFVEAYYSEFLGLQKDRIAKQMPSNHMGRFLFPEVQS